MLRSVVRFVALAVGASIVGGIASAVAAVRYRQDAPPRPDPAADEIDLAVVMDGGALASTAPAFRGGRVISWYAGTDLDLRGATLDPSGAHLDVRTVFGGTRIVVAPGTPVRIAGPAIFGGRQDATGSPEPTAGNPGLDITGFTIFGGLRVIAAEPGEALDGWGGERAGEKAAGEAAPGAPAMPASPAPDALPSVEPMPGPAPA